MDVISLAHRVLRPDVCCPSCLSCLLSWPYGRPERRHERAERARLPGSAAADAVDLKVRLLTCLAAVEALGIADAQGQGREVPTVQASPGLGGWHPGMSTCFKLRVGPDYGKKGLKEVPGPPLYRCIGADVIRGEAQIRCAIAELGEVVSLDHSPPKDLPASLPTAIVVNFQLPYEVGPVYGQHPPHDTGCSVLLFFELDRHAAQPPESRSKTLLAEYLEESGHPLREGRNVSKCLKVIGLIENIEDLEIPGMLLPAVRKFNGKPVLIEKECRRFATAARNVVELAVDVRGFNPVARSLLRQLRGQLPKVTVNLGLTLQGCLDEELPEQLIGAVDLVGMDLTSAMWVRAGLSQQGVLAPEVAVGVWWSGALEVLSKFIGEHTPAIRRCPTRFRPPMLPRRRSESEVSAHWLTPRSSATSGE